AGGAGAGVGVSVSWGAPGWASRRGSWGGSKGRCPPRVRTCGTRPAAAHARSDDVLTPSIRAASDTGRSRLSVSAWIVMPSPVASSPRGGCTPARQRLPSRTILLGGPAGLLHPPAHPPTG